MKNSAKKIARALLDVVERTAIEEEVSAAAIVREMISLRETQSSQPSVTVYTAHELSTATMKRIEQFLKKRLHTTDLVIQTVIDPTLYGGFIARFRDREFDFSVSAALRELRSYV